MNDQSQIQFERVLSQPFIKPARGSPAPDAVTTPDVFTIEDDHRMVVGAVDAGQESLISFPFPIEALQSGSSVSVPENASVVLKPGPYDFNCNHVFDPAIVSWGKEFFLYYSAVGKRNDSIGLATSSDGIRFNKYPRPILSGRSPEVVFCEDKLFLFYVKRPCGHGYRIYSVESTNGISFQETRKEPVVGEGEPGEWDHYEVTTPRIFRRGEFYFLLYAASQNPERVDLPDGFGLARSSDLQNWKKYPYNPVFRLGQKGSWDDGAIWFGDVFNYMENLFLVYEGGRMEDIQTHSPGLTQVGLAQIRASVFDQIAAAW